MSYSLPVSITNTAWVSLGYGPIQIGLGTGSSPAVFQLSAAQPAVSSTAGSPVPNTPTAVNNTGLPGVLQVWVLATTAAGAVVNVTTTQTLTEPDGTRFAELPQRLRDNVGKMEVSEVQNLFEADFEYGAQPMRWEPYTVGGATIVAQSTLGGVVISVTSASGDCAIRQTRPYIRYQPGKTLYMASGMLFGPAYVNQRQRLGFFDDGNGVFFEQGDPTTTNPTGMTVVYRSDANGMGVTDTRIYANNWSDPQGVFRGLNPKVGAFNVNNIQMWWVEYAWYGAGLLRWGVMIQGEPYVLHQIGVGNLTSQTLAWARTGNLPVRYELRNIGPSTAGSMVHYGVSVLAKGKIDPQRGFTYGYGMAPGTPTRSPGASATRYPLLSIRYRVMGTLEYGVDTNYSGANGNLPAGGAAIASASSTAVQSTINLTGTPLVAGAWVGKYVFCRGATASITGITITSGVATATTAANPNYLNVGRWVTIAGATAGGGTINGQVQITGVTANTFTFNTTATGSVTGTITYSTGQGSIGRVTANTTSALTIVDNVQNGPLPVLPGAGGNYILGVINRGQVLPQSLNIYSSANCTLELIASTYSSPVALTGATFATMYSLGSLNSFVERDVSATSLSGGEVVYNAPLPAGSTQPFDLSNFFPLYNNIQGCAPDLLTVAITTPSGFSGNVGASIVGQEAMS